MIELRTVNLTRYITPLREGGSLPALAEADDEFKYVVKFRGAGHGTKALISELILMKHSDVPKEMKKYKIYCKPAVG